MSAAMSIDGHDHPVSAPLHAVKMRTTYGKHFEEWFPVGFAVVAALASLSISIDPKAVYAVLGRILPSIIDTSAILAGFQGTALALLFSLSDTKPLQALKAQKKATTLVRFTMRSVVSMLALCLFAIVLQGWQSVVANDFGAATPWIASFAAFVFVLAIGNAARSLFLVGKLLRLPALLG